MGVVLTDADGTPLHQALETYPCNKPAENLFYRFSKQWKRNPMTGELEYLDYQALQAGAKMAGIKITPQLFDDLQAIEHGALGLPVELPELDEVEILHVGFEDHGE